MKSPLSGNEMKVVKELHEMSFRKEKFQVVFHTWFCEETGEKFEDEQFSALNYNQVINQYRVRHRIPFPEQIIAIRSKYDVSAARMSEILGLGANSWRNYEAGEVPAKSIATTIQMISNPLYFRDIILKCSELEDKERDKILKHIQKQISDIDWLSDPLFIFENQPEITTGFKRFNREKTKQVILYFAQQQQPYKTKMNKLLFYTDFWHFANNAQSITGLKYKAIQHGPVPNNYDVLFSAVANEEIIESYCTLTDNGELERFSPAQGRDFDPSLFSPSEIQTLEFISNKFKKTSAREIVEISHHEPAWLNNIDEKRIISFQYAFQLETF
jgi:uncharacterized phage-associated protein